MRRMVEVDGVLYGDPVVKMAHFPCVTLPGDSALDHARTQVRNQAAVVDVMVPQELGQDDCVFEASDVIHLCIAWMARDTLFRK
jgi:hypothetical protein